MNRLEREQREQTGRVEPEQHSWEGTNGGRGTTCGGALRGISAREETTKIMSLNVQIAGFTKGRENSTEL